MGGHMREDHDPISKPVRRFLISALALVALLWGCTSAPPDQILYEIEIRRDAEVLSRPNVLVNRGESAEVIIGLEGGSRLETLIRANGTVEVHVPVSPGKEASQLATVVVDPNGSGSVEITVNGVRHVVEVRSSASVVR